MATDKSIHHLRFDAAVKVIENLPADGSYQPSQDMMRMFYSYYKQATHGPCDVPKPNSWNTEEKAQWEAWKALGSMTKEEAMLEYVQEIKLILEIFPINEEVSELLDVLDNFYEFVDNDGELMRSVEFIRAPHSGTDQNLASGYIEFNDTECGVEGGDEGDDEDEEDEEEHSGDGHDSEDEMEVVLEKEDYQCVDLSGPMVDVTWWRGGSPVDNAVVEKNSPSLSNGTPSSLNTREEDEELACSLEPPAEKLLCCVDAPVSDDKGVASGQSHHTQATDNEVNCDSSEHPAPEEGATVPRISLATPEGGRARRQNPQGGNKAGQCGNQEPNPQHSPPYIHAHGTVQPDQGSVQMEGGSSLGTEPCSHSETDCQDSERSKPTAMEDINKDVVIALTRLQADMQDVLRRLNTLEALSDTQTKSLELREEQLTNETKKRISWWPFSLSPATMSLAIAWPLLVHWIIDFYYQRRRKQLH
ncbi:acyl-CoA-binding domain-containing protein 5-B [Sardina pilchardus]|uniref:acyl-CoA-binding domain-containing protein 5-B n=1 Tax=Sardina pilchardus TaxID=27697 RepID=UPI002E11C31D